MADDTLERKLNTTLFIRSRRGMLLTPEGQVLFRYCQRVNEMSGQVLSQINGVGINEAVRVCIAGPTSIMRSRIIPQCQSVMKAFNHLLVTFQIDDCEDISQRLKLGDVDFVILRPEQVTAEMKSKLLAPEHYLLLCTPHWQQRKLKEILKQEKIIDFDSTDQMTFSYLKHFNLLQTMHPERHFVNNTETIAQLFIAGFGYGVLTQEFAEPYIKRRELHVLNQGKIYANILALAWYPRPEQPKYFSALIEAFN